MTKEFDIIIEKKYAKNIKKPHIALVMMHKQEEARMHVSLDSTVGHVDSCIMYDTGSTDNTIDIVKKHCEKHKINLYMIKGDFVNFCVSRNVVLEYADTISGIDFLLLMDVNDELRNGEKLRKFAEAQLKTKNNGYLICQHWWSGQYDKYFNMRFVKAQTGWRYKGSVHEWMYNINAKKDEKPQVLRIPDDIVLYQDRTKDNNKSSKRFKRDRELLLADYKKNPTEPRTLFYLAQTCSCLNYNEEAYYYYKLRTELEGFQEEKFHAYLRCGDLCQKLDQSWGNSLEWYMKSLEHSARVEALIKLANHYKDEKKWLIAFMYIQTACVLKYPEHCILFVDKHAYDYTRWHLMGIIGYYCGQYKLGKEGCVNAIKCGLNSELDKNNLKFYEDKEKELVNKINSTSIDAKKQPLTKKQFLNQKINELKIKNKNITNKKAKTLALSQWKTNKENVC